MKKINRHGRTLTPSIDVVIIELMIRFTRLARATFESSCLLLETIAPGAALVNAQAIPARGRQFNGKGESGTMNGGATIINPTADDLMEIGEKIEAVSSVLMEYEGPDEDNSKVDGILMLIIHDYSRMIQNTVRSNFWTIKKALDKAKESKVEVIQGQRAA